MRSQKGLTALELLIVVAVIAMLAAVAVPRFSSLDREAREQAVLSLANGVESSLEITHRVWSAAGRPERLVFQGAELQFVHGYPVEQALARTVVGPGGFRHANGMWVHEEARSALDCGVVYLAPTVEGAAATVNAYTAGC